MIGLIEFYEKILKIKKQILLNLLFIYTLIQLLKMPMYFLFSFFMKNNIDYTIDDVTVSDYNDCTFANKIYELNNLISPFRKAIRSGRKNFLKNFKINKINNSSLKKNGNFKTL